MIHLYCLYLIQNATNQPNDKNHLIDHYLDSSQNFQKQKGIVGEYIFTPFCQFMAQD